MKNVKHTSTPRTPSRRLIALGMMSLAMTMGIPRVSSAQSPAIPYTQAGAPDFSRYVVGKTTVEQITADLGTPVSSQTDTSGEVTDMDFVLPLQGKSAASNSAVAATAKGMGLATLKNHAGSILSHIPGLGGIAAAAAVDAGTAKVAGEVVGIDNKVWLCSVFFDHNHFASARCGQTPQPFGG